MRVIELSEEQCLKDWAEVAGEIVMEIMRKKGLQEGPKIYLALEKYLNDGKWE